MPCFQGVAISIHTPNGPLPEYSIQRQSKHHRITSYIPVPPASISLSSTSSSSKPEQSTFAISITILTPGLEVPYSASHPSPDNPWPRSKVVSGFLGYADDKRSSKPIIAPYIPLTTSLHETLAAYIYFDGRPKEEVATLLRRGEETWVNSRWVALPESEGGGLAEREFLFREVGLERWLKGLDLQGKDEDIAAKIERRRQRMERKRQKKRDEQLARSYNHSHHLSGNSTTEINGVSTSGDINPFSLLNRLSDTHSSSQDVASDVKTATCRSWKFSHSNDSTIRSSTDGTATTTAGECSISLEDEGRLAKDTNDIVLNEFFSSDSENDAPVSEAAGQIRIALFRVLVSGDVKRGEFVPQFDAYDNEFERDSKFTSCSDVDHTTSFAQPRSLDASTISTQKVSGIDSPDNPYAVFTFLYRSERQLRRMGILPSTDTTSSDQKSVSNKRKSRIDFSDLKPLDSQRGTRNFAGYRDKTVKTRFGGSAEIDSDEADEDDEIDKIKCKVNDESHSPEVDKLDEEACHLTAEEARQLDGVSERVRKIKLKRQNSFSTHSEATRDACYKEVVNLHKTSNLSNSSNENSGTTNDVYNTKVRSEDKTDGIKVEGILDPTVAPGFASEVQASCSSSIEVFPLDSKVPSNVSTIPGTSLTSINLKGPEMINESVKTFVKPTISSKIVSTKGTGSGKKDFENEENGHGNDDKYPSGNELIGENVRDKES